MKSEFDLAMKVRFPSYHSIELKTENKEMFQLWDGEQLLINLTEEEFISFTRMINTFFDAAIGD